MIFYSKQKAAVLLFHRVLPQRDALWDPIDPALFSKTIKFIGKNFHVISLNELLFERPLSSKPLAAITFDDGYRDFIDYAAPVLDKEKQNASMFVVTDCIDNGLPTWTYIVDTLFANTQKNEWNNYNMDEFPEEFRKTTWATKEERVNYCRKFKQHLKWIPSIKREDVIKCLFANFNDVDIPADTMMNWDEVKQISSAGFDIGSHSVSHPSLSTIADEQSISYELTRSAERIKEKTGISSKVFSYPLGSYDDRTKRLCREAGYKASLAVDKMMYDPTMHDLYAVPRIELYSESWLKTRLRINGTESLFKQFLKK